MDKQYRDKYGLPDPPIGMPQVESDLIQKVAEIVMGDKLSENELDVCMECAECDLYANSDTLPEAIPDWLHC